MLRQVQRPDVFLRVAAPGARSVGPLALPGHADRAQIGTGVLSVMDIRDSSQSPTRNRTTAAMCIATDPTVESGNSE